MKRNQIDKKRQPWIGIDLDGTLATFDINRISPHYIGEPVKPIVDWVKNWHAKGIRIKIFTARVSYNWMKQVGLMESRIIKPTIKGWCQKHLGFIPEITAEKDHLMVALIDDIILCQVQRDTGEFLDRRSVSRIDS